MPALCAANFKIHAGTEHQKPVAAAWVILFHLKNVAGSHIHVPTSSASCFFSLYFYYTTKTPKPEDAKASWIHQRNCVKNIIYDIIRKNSAETILKKAEESLWQSGSRFCSV
jgi:hypothetical protein